MLKSQTFSEENCQRTSFRETSSAVDWKYECTGKFSISRSGSIKFDTASHYTGILKMTGNMMGQMIDESSIMEGTRLGACPADKGSAQPAPPSR